MSAATNMDALVNDIYGLAFSAPFHDIPSEKSTSEHATIRRPISLNIVKSKLQQGQYASASGQDWTSLAYDLALMIHNAQIDQNDPSIISAAQQLEAYIKSHLPDGVQFPVISNDPLYDEVEKEEEEDDADDVEGEDELGNIGDISTVPRKRGRPRKEPVSDGDGEASGQVDADGEPVKRKRGRPPIIKKPFEHKIMAILKIIQRARDSKNRVLVLPFDRLPNAKQFPDYYERIKNPISLEHVYKRIKDRTYESVDAFVADIDQMLANARSYYPLDTKIHQDAISLDKILRRAVADVQHPDYDVSAPQDQQQYGSPSSSTNNTHRGLDSVEFKGETYVVGDWVHVKNPNEASKPIIGQVQRFWQTSDGRRWLNLLWYYRPEQTVHSVYRMFFESEVFRSARYHDHCIDDLLGKCFVMYVNKYIKGRPRGIGGVKVYCCESKYSDDDKTFAKIRTWKVCTPESANAEHEYEMDYFDKPHPIVKVPSPIKNLLPLNASPSDPIPEPKFGMPNAPPIVGAVFLGPPDVAHQSQSQPSQHQQPASQVQPPHQQQHQPLPPSTNKMQAANSAYHSPSTYSAQDSASATPSAQIAASSSPAVQSELAQLLQIAATPQNPNHRMPIPLPAYLSPGIPLAFTLADHIQSSLSPSELETVARSRGQMAWFSAPPVWIPERRSVLPISTEIEPNMPQGDSSIDAFHCGHSARYIAWRLARGY